MRYFAFFLLAGPVFADPASITDISATQNGGTWRFDVTIAHPDTGWDHYADGWRIEDANGSDLGTRILAHPHVNEQPFTRSLGGVVLPDDLRQVFIRARDNIDGWGTEVTAFTLPAPP